jgi:hypothetical protein
MSFIFFSLNAALGSFGGFSPQLRPVPGRFDPAIPE